MGAGYIVAMPANGASAWGDFTTLVQGTFKSMLFLGLTNWDSTAIPEVEDGSWGVINGAVFKLTEDSTNGTITNLSGIANYNNCYFMAEPVSTVITVAAYTSNPSSWDADKGGFYDGNNRLIGGCRKDNSGNYTNKWVMGSGGSGRSRALFVDTETYGDARINEDLNVVGTLRCCDPLNSVTIATATNQTTIFYIQKPISAYYTSDGASGILSIEQNSNDRTITSGAVTTYNLQLNPGKYIIESGAGVTASLIATGAYGITTNTLIGIQGG